MVAVTVKPNQTAVITNIGNDLESLQKFVGGYIAVIYPFKDTACLICNEEGQLKGLEFNRTLKDKSELYDDVICGNFIICSFDYDGNFKSLTAMQSLRYLDMFFDPEHFYVIGNRVIKLKS